MAEAELTCPVDHAALLCDGETLRCVSCDRVYHRIGLAWDLRIVLSDATAGWDADAFDHAYREAELGFEGGMEHAVRTRIPRPAGEYCEQQKGRRLEEWVREHRPQRLLDLGCGNGWFCFRLAGLSPDTKFCGVDVSPHCVNLFLRRAADQAERYGGMTAALAGGEELPFADKEFETVVLQEVLEHVRNPEQVMGETYRVLCPGGWVLVSTPTMMMTRLWKTLAWLPIRLRHWWQGQFRDGSGAMSGVRDQPLSHGHLRAILRRTGLEIVSWRRVIFLPHESYLQFFPRWILRLMIAGARLMERLPGVGMLGLHHVVILRRPLEMTRAATTTKIFQ